MWMLRVLNYGKNGGRGTNPIITLCMMVINPLLPIEFKATLNGNPIDNFHWRQNSISLNVVQSNTTSRPITFYRPNLYSMSGKF